MDPVTLSKVVALAALAVGCRGYIHAEYKLYRDFKPSRRRGWIGRLAAYNTIYLCAAIAPLIAPFIADTMARVGLVAYFTLSGTALILYCRVSGHHIDKRFFFDDDVIELLWRERNQVRAPDLAYRGQIVPVALGAIAVAAALLPPSQSFNVETLVPASVAAIGVLGILLGKVSRRSPPFPSLCAIPMDLLVHILRHEMPESVATREVSLRAQGTGLNKIIVVMDGNIRGDCLSINNRSMETTPYLESRDQLVINFGTSVSSHNFSSYSRYIFRSGVRTEDLLYRLFGGLNFAGPNIWQYARAAGFKTVYIDGFPHSWRRHSGMTPREARFIDHVIHLPEVKLWERDGKVAERLLEALRDPEPAFIYIEKFGMHGPYGDGYPADMQMSKPESASARDAQLAAYKNALRRSVDGFFRKVLPKIDLQRAVLIYTSDHGQRITDNGYAFTPGVTGPDVAQEEAQVPLFAVTQSEPLRMHLVEAAVRFRDRATHFDIFPALLFAFGYERQCIISSYGNGLLGEPRLPRKFLVGFKKNVRWVPVKEASTSAVLGKCCEQVGNGLKVVVINRDSDSRRRRLMQEQLKAAGIEFTFFRAIDAERGEHAHLSRHNPDISRRVGGYVLAPSEIACFASHHAVWKRCIATQTAHLIFEDDVYIHADFTRQLNLALSLMARGIVRLGFNPSGLRPLVPTTDILDGQRVFSCPPGSTCGSFCYLVTPEHAANLLAFAQTWTEPVDHYIEATHKHGVPNLSFEMPTLNHVSALASTMVDRREKEPFSRLDTMQVRLKRGLDKTAVIIRRLFNKVLARGHGESC